MKRYSLKAEDIIDLLNLKPLPLEGGYYRETYRSQDRIMKSALPVRYQGDKEVATAIYYLLTADTCSAMHRLPTDEIYHFYLGDPVVMLNLCPDGGGSIVTLGQDISHDEVVQYLVPSGVWQGSMLKPGGEFALLGTTMAPGFDSSDWEIGHASHLTAHHSDYTTLIERLCGIEKRNAGGLI